MTVKKKYLQLGKYYPPQWGGIETVTYNLMQVFTNAGIDNDVLVFGNNLNIKNHFNTVNILRTKYYNFFGAPISINYLKLLRKIAAEYSHIIIHLPNPWAILCLSFINYKGKIVIYWHSDIINKGIFELFVRPIELWILKKASIIIAPTKAHILFSKYSAQLSKKYKIIPFPVDDYLFELANNKLPRNLSNLSIDNPLKIISIGRLVSYKGFEYLIRSIPLILKQIPCRLDIVGDGPLKEKLIRLIESMDLHGKVFIHGALSKKSLHQLLSDSDLYCLPSITNAEMYGMVQYEAMAHGLPIIATEIPKSGVPVLIKDTSAGILVKPKLPNEIASGIIKIIFEPGLYNNLSIAGLNSIKNRFSQIRFVKEFEDAI